MIRLNKDGTLRLVETDVRGAVESLLLYEGWRVMATPVGRFRSLDGKRVITVGTKGQPDLLALKAGKQIFIETKKPVGGVLSPEQIEWRDWLIANGYVWLRINKVEELQEWLTLNE